MTRIVVGWGKRHWLALANSAAALFVALPLAAPVLLLYGLTDPAASIFGLFQFTCHQWPFRSYFLFGPQFTYSFSELQARGVPAPYDFHGSPELGFSLAYCQRNLAIYGAALLGGLLYGGFRDRARPLGLHSFFLLAAPMALDGVTQIVGWRESTWELRTVSGLLFGSASVWLIYPRIDRAVRLLTQDRPTFVARRP